MGTDPMGARIARLQSHIAHPARMYDYYLGGKDNYAADRAAADELIEAMPDGAAGPRLNRAFLRRVVHVMARVYGIRQFIDLGSGLPTKPTVYDTATQFQADAGVVYVDNDPMVAAHLRHYHNHEPNIWTIEADLRDPEAIIKDDAVASLIDSGEPIGLLLVAVLHFIRDEDGASDIVSRWRGALPTGSMLAISSVTTTGTPPEIIDTMQRVYARASAPAVVRTHDEIAALFGDWPLITPGLTDVGHWRPWQTPSFSAARCIGGVAISPRAPHA